MKRQNIQARVGQIIEDRRAQLQKEIAEWEDKALEKRKKELDELEEFARQLGKYTPYKEVGLYFLHCRNCGNVFMSNYSPTREWHECPCCKKMVYDNNPRRTVFRVEDDGQPWLSALQEEEADTWT